MGEHKWFTSGAVVDVAGFHDPGWEVTCQPCEKLCVIEAVTTDIQTHNTGSCLYGHVASPDQLAYAY